MSNLLSFIAAAVSLVVVGLTFAVVLIREKQANQAQSVDSPANIIRGFLIK